MRILNVTESYAPFYEFGGPPAKVEALSDGLAALGHEVTVLTADWGFERRENQAPSAKTPDRSPFGWRWEQNGVRAIYLPTWFRYRALSWNPAVKRFCRARLAQFDAVHIFGLYDLLGPAVAAFCRKRSVPYVVEPIGMFLPIVRNVRLKRLYHALYGKNLFSGAAAVIVTAEQELDELARGGIPREKIVLRRNGVAMPRTLPLPGAFRSAWQISENAAVILFLGRLSAKKSPDLLLSAFASLPPELAQRELLLVFVGPDEAGMKRQLRETAAKLGVSARVRFVPSLFGGDKWRAYRDADVFVLPSLNENFGNTAAEAAAIGTPVIVTENCGIAPILADSAIVIPHEQNALAQALKTALSDSVLHARLSAAGKSAAACLDWTEPVHQMEALYSNLAAARRTSGQ